MNAMDTALIIVVVFVTVALFFYFMDRLAKD
jgi:hypothetical protein